MRDLLLRGMLGGGAAPATYDDYIQSLSPILHFPLTEVSGTAAANQGSLGAAANGAYSATIALAQVTAPGGGWSPLVNPALGANAKVNIYSAAFAAAFDKQLFSVVVWWKVSSAGVWTDGVTHYVFAISSDSSNQVFTNKTTANGTLQNTLVNEGDYQLANTTGHAETGWMCTVHTVSKAANQYKVYENGTLVGTKTVPKTWTAALAAGECVIGNGRTLGYAWSGYLSRFSVFNRVLSQDEITEIYTKGVAALEDMPVNAYAAVRAESPLTIPTYDESGQAVHPSVYYNADGWNGHKYWMVMTPYTGSNGLVENPSIVVSEDGITWTVPDGLTNPIYAYTANGFNSDPELVMSGNTLYVIFRDSSDTTHFNYKCISSTDGVTWSAAADLFATDSPAEEASPAIVYANGRFYMFTVLYNVNTNTSSFRRRECATINGTWSDPVDITYTSDFPHPISPWHIGVIKSAGEEKLLMAISTLDRKYIYMAQSLDYGLTWVVDPWPMLSTGTAPAWDDFAVYRPAMAYVGADLVLWYSGASVAAGPVYTWGTARTVITTP